MKMSEINNWDVSSDNNNSAPPDGAPEATTRIGQLNNIIRELMAVCARWFKDTNGSLVSTGTNTIAVTTNRSISSYYDGMRITFRAAGVNTSACTLNINTIGAKSLKTPTGEELRAGVINTDGIYDAVYCSNSDEFVLLGSINNDKVLTTEGDIIYRDGTGYQRLAIGSANQLLKSNGTTVSWGNITGSELVLGGDAHGDIVFRNSTRYDNLPPGTAGQLLTTNGSGSNPSWENGSWISSDVSLSGNAEVEINSIPSWATRLEIGITDGGLSVNSRIGLRLGTASSMVISGYEGRAAAPGAASLTHDSQFYLIPYNSNSSAHEGHITLVKSPSNKWFMSGVMSRSDGGETNSTSSGRVDITGTLTRIRLIVNSGVFDNGSFFVRAWR